MSRQIILRTPELRAQLTQNDYVELLSYLDRIEQRLQAARAE